MNAVVLDRRKFLQLAAGTGAAALIVGIDAVGQIVRAQDIKMGSLGPGVFGAWLMIGADDTVTLVNPETEYGQGTATANAMLVAEELDVDMSRIAIIQSGASRVYANPGSHRLSTDGSWGMRGRFDQMRQIGATARLLLLQAAALAWGVPAGECTSADGAVHHAASNRSSSYGSVAEAASKLPMPATVQLKPSTQWRLIGTSAPRLDIRQKCTGQAKYAVDFVMPGLLYAAFARCPVLGGTVRSVDDSAVRARTGVRHVISVSYAVAVIAEDAWTARNAAENLKIEWDEGPAAAISTETLARDYAAALADKPGVVAKTVGDVNAAEGAAGAKILEAVYTVPYLTQQCMEPTNATAWVHDGICEVWTPTASMGNVVDGIGYAFGFSPDKIKVHRAAFVGGSFGLRGRVDPELEAVQLSQKVGAPVQVVRRREEDVQHGWYRPYEMVKLKGAINAAGELTSWRHKVAVQSINAHIFDELIPFGVNIAQVNATFRKESAFYRMPVDYYAISGSPMTTTYQMPNLLVEGVEMNVPVPVTHWRSVGYSGNTYVVESFVDEMAHLADCDPIEFRRRMLKGNERYLGVLDALATHIDWPQKQPRGRGWGIASGDGFACFCAVAVEVSVQHKKLTIHRIVCVYDQGTTVNQDQTQSQVQGGVIDGLSAAMYGEITLHNGRVQQNNFNDYRLVSLAQMPPIEQQGIDGGGKIGSITEMITPTLIPALTNAIFAATGQRIRDLPLKNHGFDL